MHGCHMSPYLFFTGWMSFVTPLFSFFFHLVFLQPKRSKARVFSRQSFSLNFVTLDSLKSQTTRHISSFLFFFQGRISILGALEVASWVDVQWCCRLIVVGGWLLSPDCRGRVVVARLPWESGCYVPLPPSCCVALLLFIFLLLFVIHGESERSKPQGSCSKQQRLH